MRKTVGVLICLSLVTVLGCKKLMRAAMDDAADASDDKASAPASAAAADAAPAAAATASFANVSDIARYPDEKPFADEKASVHTNMLARTAVPSGAVVATILTGKPVTKLASHQGFVLVSFEDPKDPSRTLLGWIAQGGLAAPGAVPAAAGTAAAASTANAANAASSAKSKPPTCAPGQQPFTGFGCLVECPNGNECKKVPGTECVGGQFIDEPGGGNHIGRACLKTAGLPPQKKCKPGEILAADECALKCDIEKPKCPAGKKCDVARFRGESGDFVVENICQ